MSAVAEHPVDDATVLLRTDVPDGGFAVVDAALTGIVDPTAVRLVEVLDDGLDAWRDHARIVEVGRRLVVRPPWVEVDGGALAYRGPAPMMIEIDPGRSWGHGAHPTTRLCLAEIERVLDATPGLGLIDVGCGSGVLTVAAALLGARWVEAFDIDPAAVEATRANAERNGVADRVRAHRVPSDHAHDPLAAFDPSPAEPTDPPAELAADLIVANIGAAALVEMLPTLRRQLAPGGTLILSGLLDPPPPELLAACQPGVPVITTLDGWSALTL